MPDPNASRQGEPSYIKEAFKWQYNLIALGGAAAFSMVSGSPLPVILAAGAELMYLATVPQISAFQRLVRSWRYQNDRGPLHPAAEMSHKCSSCGQNERG